MSFDIHLSKIKCFGKHGIYDNEKDNDQKFLVDIYIKIPDFLEDDIGNTINYEEIVDLVIKIVEHESFNLIESLSKNIVKLHWFCLRFVSGCFLAPIVSAVFQIWRCLAQC